MSEPNRHAEWLRVFADEPRAATMAKTFPEKCRAAADHIDSIESKLEAMAIHHPTDVCACRFDFSDGMKVRNVCDYHKGIADRLDSLSGLARQVLNEFDAVGGTDFRHCAITTAWCNQVRAVINGNVVERHEHKWFVQPCCPAPLK